MKKAVMLVTMLAVLAFAGCSSQQKETNKIETYPVTHAMVMDTVYYTDYVAEIQASNYVEIRARVKGYVEKIHVDEGATVKKGQVLFSISNREYQEELLKAKSELKSLVADAKALELELGNIKTLTEKNVVSKSQLEIGQAKLEALRAKIEEAESNVAQAELDLSYTQIKAPFHGTIDRIPNKAGSLVDEGALLTTLSNSNEVFVYFNVSEREYLEFYSNKDLSYQNNISLILANNEEHKHRGVIETINGKIDRNTGSLSLRARFPNAEQLIKHGASGKVRIGNSLEKALIVPQKATFEVQDKLFVYVVDEKNKVHRRSIIPKLRIPHLYVIDGGITENEKIIFEGIQTVKEGDEIKPEMVPDKKMMASLVKAGRGF